MATESVNEPSPESFGARVLGRPKTSRSILIAADHLRLLLSVFEFILKAQFDTIYLQSSVADNAQANQRAQAILARFPEAEVIEVPTHLRIADLHHADPQDWIDIKRHKLVLGMRSTMTHKVNGRSADFIAAGMSVGCLSACSYCYVARWRGGSNPLTIFCNVDAIADSIERHQRRRGPKTTPNQCDDRYWTYDIGCNADLSLDASVCDHPKVMVERFANMRYAKATFATKTVAEDVWTSVDPKGRTRIRYSLMPAGQAKHIDIGTTAMHRRIKSINTLVDAGYEVHVNFSPIVLTGSPDDDWLAPWRELWTQVDDELSPAAKKQLACEAFFLTHSKSLHERNLQWHPKGEELLWTPETQRYKGPGVLTYKRDVRETQKLRFAAQLEQHLPYCPVRYSF